MKKQIKFIVKGMHCGSCERLIKMELSELKGVSDPAVDYKTGQGSLLLDTTLNSVEDVLNAISNTGYTVAVSDGI